MPNTPSCDCGFDIPAGGCLNALNLNNALGIASGGTGANTADNARTNLGIYCGLSDSVSGLKSSSAKNVSISFPVTFASTPIVVVTVRCQTVPSNANGIWHHITSSSTSGATVRLTTTASSAIDPVRVAWIAIGEVSS